MNPDNTPADHDATAVPPGAASAQPRRLDAAELLRLAVASERRQRALRRGHGLLPLTTCPDCDATPNEVVVSDPVSHIDEIRALFRPCGHAFTANSQDAYEMSMEAVRITDMEEYGPPDPEPPLPVSSAPLASGLPLVKGSCPACRSAALFLGVGGYVTCSVADCPAPDAASTLLEQQRPAPVRSCGEECADGHTRVTRCTEAGEGFARETVRTPPTSGEPAPAWLRDRYADAVESVIRFPQNIIDDLADAVMAVRDRALEQLAAGRATWKRKAEEIDRDRARLEADLRRATEELARRDAAESADAAAGSYAGRAEDAEAARDRLIAERDDLQHNLAARAFTAPDADFDTILDSLDARIADAVQRAKQAEAALDRVRDAAALHRKGLLTSLELYAVIEAAPEESR